LALRAWALDCHRERSEAIQVQIKGRLRKQRCPHRWDTLLFVIPA
jgi:hypothetical protein